MKYKILNILCLIAGFSWSDVTVEVCGFGDKICTVTIPSAILAGLTTSGKFERYLLGEVVKINPFWREEKTYFMSEVPVEVPEDGQTMRVDIAKDTEIAWVSRVGILFFTPITGDYGVLLVNKHVPFGEYSLNKLIKLDLKFEINFWRSFEMNCNFEFDLNKKNLDFKAKWCKSLEKDNWAKHNEIHDRVFGGGTEGLRQFVLCVVQILGITAREATNVRREGYPIPYVEFSEDKVLVVREYLREIGLLKR